MDDDKKVPDNVIPFDVPVPPEGEVVETNCVSLEALQARFGELQESRANVLANLSAHNGAIDEVGRLISMVSKD